VQQPAWTKVIEGIHASGKQLVIAVTGGGSLAIGELLKVPGGSGSVLEAVVPYAATALEAFLGGKPDQFCSEPTSRAMAMAAWMRAYKLAPHANPETLIGIGVTASLVSNVPKRGEHRIHIGVQSARETSSYSLTLEKGARDRPAEEELSAQLVLLALGEACGVDTTAVRTEFQGQLKADEHIAQSKQMAMTFWTQLLLGEANYVSCGTNALPKPKAVFPGAFNPIHTGHCEMVRIAGNRVGGEVAYEISIANVDKPPLDFMEIHDRLEEIGKQEPDRQVLLTSAPTFREKSKLFPGTTFVVGIDTLERIADPRYYGDDERQRDQAIAEIAQAGCRFLVFGRELAGKFCCLDDLQLPSELQLLCDEVPANEFQKDVSSTEMRTTNDA
jgi:nicotinic acid mononucleotide adenylyltransferase